MKSRKQVNCENRIIQLRGELHQLIEIEHLGSCRVQKISKELDELIMMYYKLIKNPIRGMSSLE